MNLSCVETNDKLILTLDGSLDETAASSLPAKLSQFCSGKNQNNIVLDLSACHIDSVLGFGALITFRLAPCVLGREVSIQNALPQVMGKMKLLRFEKLFKLT